RRRLVLVTQEAAKQQLREICLRGGPVRRIAHVTGKMFRDDASAAREQDECAAEVLPTLVLVRFFDKRLFRGGEAREQEGKPYQLDARLEVQLLHGFPFGIRQLFDRIQLEEHVFVAERQRREQLRGGGVVLERAVVREVPHARYRGRERGAILARLRRSGKPGAREHLRKEMFAELTQRIRARGRLVAEVRPHRGFETGPGHGGGIFVRRL